MAAAAAGTAAAAAATPIKTAPRRDYTSLSPHRRQSIIGALGMGVLEKGVRPVPPEQDD